MHPPKPTRGLSVAPLEASEGASERVFVRETERRLQPYPILTIPLP
jgi:hypothetical protein